MHHPVHQSGYTLLEMTIVLAIMGTIAGSVLTLGSAKHEASKIDLTRQRLDKIENAIRLHSYTAGYLPCTADPTTLPGDATYGLSADCGGVAPVGIDTSGTGANEVWIGAIPNRSLNLPDSVMYDGWQNRFTYAAVADLAVSSSSFSSYTTSSTSGVIQIVDNDGTQVTDPTTDTVVAYAVISHGKDKKGAITRNGTMPIICGATTKDDENCDADAVFRDSRIVDSTLAANYYDDLIRWKARHFMQPPKGTFLHPESWEAILSAGGGDTCMVKGDGTLWCLGENNYGQLGDGTTTPSNTFVQTSGLSGVATVSTGDLFTCAIEDDGTLWCWGDGRTGQLGQNSWTSFSTPQQVTTLSDVTVVSAGASHTCAVKADGTAWCWGYDGSGSLGALGMGAPVGYETLPQQVPGFTGATRIAVGWWFSCAVKGDGTAWCWGSNIEGQLGNGTTSGSYSPVQVSGLTNVSDIALGDWHACALKEDGTAWCWGLNFNGQLGDGTGATSSVPVQVSGLTGATSISARNRHACALKDDGTVWCWGQNDDGELGDGTTTDRLTPVQVSGLSEAVAVAVGWNHTCALKGDGTAWCWGSNDDGQLGDGTTTDRLTPVQMNLP